MGSPISKARGKLNSNENHSSPLSNNHSSSKVNTLSSNYSNFTPSRNQHARDFYHTPKQRPNEQVLSLSSSSEEDEQPNQNQSISYSEEKMYQHQHQSPLPLSKHGPHHTFKDTYSFRHNKTRTIRNPIIDISSSSSSSSSSASTILSLSGINKALTTRQTSTNFKRSQQQSSCPSSMSSYSSDYNNDEDTINDEEVYDWLEFNSNTSQQIHNSTKPTHKKTPAKNQSFSTPSRSTCSKKLTFTPPGWDSPLQQASSLSSKAHKCNRQEGNPMVKDTNRVKRTNAQLPSKKPDVTKGNWLTNRLVVNNYIILHCLGTGSYGEVRLCKEKHTNKLFAVKVISRTKAEFSSALDDLRMEVAIMKKLRHENCVNLYEVMDDPRVNKLYLVLEYMRRGDLMQIMDGKPMDDNDTWDIMRQVIRGLKYLHDNNIVHGDLKPQNLLVASDGTVKIGDFGLSKMIDENEMQKEYIGTPAFMAPEVCNGVSFDGKTSDLYSVGATIFYIRFGQPPFEARNLGELYVKIRNSPVYFPLSAAKGLEEIIEALMVKIPSLRLMMAELMEAPWLHNRPGQENTQQMTKLVTSYKRVQICNDDIYNSIQDLSQRIEC